MTGQVRKIWLRLGGKGQAIQFLIYPVCSDRFSPNFHNTYNFFFSFFIFFKLKNVIGNVLGGTVYADTTNDCF